MNTILKSYKIRIYPNKKLQDILWNNFGYNRFVFNQLLADNNLIFNTVVNNPIINPNNNKPKINRKMTNNWLKNYKMEFEFLKDGESTGLQSTCDSYINSFKRFFIKLGRYPKFKSKKNPLQSFKIKNNNNSIRFEDGKLRLNKFGFIKYKDNRTIKGDILSATIKLENGRGYAVINCKNVPIQPLPKTGKKVGIDLGLKNLITLSNGRKREPIKTLEKMELKISKKNRDLSRKKSGSKNFKKGIKRLQKIYQKIVDIKNDEYHKLSADLVMDFDLIALETLKPSNMVKNRKLSRSISRASWSKLVEMIEYKAEWYGKEIFKVDQFFPSSKTCNKCGFQNEELKLGDRSWTCPQCNTILDRDVNAAVNILNNVNIVPQGLREL
ncbi:MAG: RNA-guided endonuclease TnpB family protein [Methanobacterium sp.]